MAFYVGYFTVLLYIKLSSYLKLQVGITMASITVSDFSIRVNALLEYFDLLWYI